MKKIFIIVITVGFCQIQSVSYAENAKPNYVFVIEDNVNVKETPDVNSKTLINLRISREVDLLKKNEKKAMLKEHEGCWAYVDTLIYNDSGNETIKGWVFDYYLAEINKFKKIKLFQESIVDAWAGDSHIYYSFYKDGTYKRRIENVDVYGNIVSEKMVNGGLYGYKNVVIARDNNSKSYRLFYLNENDLLCISFLYDEKNNNVCSQKLSDKKKRKSFKNN